MYVCMYVYETANWSLRQGDEEVNKRIKQKNIFKQFAQYFGLKTNLLQVLKERLNSRTSGIFPTYENQA